MPASPSLGLYFTDNLIEISQVSADGIKLERFNQIALPPGLVMNSEIRDTTGFTNVLRELLATARPTPINYSEEVVLGVNDSRVFLREFAIPNVPGQNINDAIEYQVRSLLPVLPTGVVTDWEIIGRSTDGQIEVLLVAIPRNIIESYVSICTEVGLKVVAVEPAVFANIRVIIPPLMQNKNQLLVFLGESFGVFSYITSGNPRFSDFLPQSEIDKNGGVDKTIKAYINFANSKHPHRPITEILVSGSRQDTDALVGSVQIEGVTMVRAVSRLAKTAVVNHSMLHTAHGLSLKTLDGEPSINLLPMDFRLDIIRGRLSGTWRAVLYGLILLTFLGTLGILLLYRNALEKENGLSVQRIQYEEQLKLPESQSLINEANKLNQLSGQLVTLRGITGGEENILRQLSAITPEGISLTSFIISRSGASKKLSDPKSTWIITGTANSRPLVLGFYRNLLATPEFAGGRLYFGSLEKDIGLTFRIANQPSIK